MFDKDTLSLLNVLEYLSNNLFDGNSPQTIKFANFVLGSLTILRLR